MNRAGTRGAGPRLVVEILSRPYFSLCMGAHSTFSWVPIQPLLIMTFKFRNRLDGVSLIDSSGSSSSQSKLRKIRSKKLLPAFLVAIVVLRLMLAFVHAIFLCLKAWLATSMRTMIFLIQQLLATFCQGQCAHSMFLNCSCTHHFFLIACYNHSFPRWISKFL